LQKPASQERRVKELVGEEKWIKNLIFDQESSVSSASGEGTALLTWLEFPDCNIRRR
jgi:hypothetical protein